MKPSHPKEQAQCSLYLWDHRKKHQEDHQVEQDFEARFHKFLYYEPLGLAARDSFNQLNTGTIGYTIKANINELNWCIVKDLPHDNVYLYIVEKTPVLYPKHGKHVSNIETTWMEDFDKSNKTHMFLQDDSRVATKHITKTPKSLPSKNLLWPVISGVVTPCCGESRGPNQILFCTRNAEIRFDANGNGIHLKGMVALEAVSSFVS